MSRARIWSLIFIFIGAALAYFIYDTQAVGSSFPFRFGLDLSGGTHLVYEADTSKIASSDRSESMAGLRDVIERRVNLFGVSEPLVQVETGRDEQGFSQDRLIVELPGVTDIDRAIALIGDTPILEFRTERPDGRTKELLDKIVGGGKITEEPYLPSPLSGKNLKRALVEFDQVSGRPSIAIEFDKEGRDLFAALTKANVGKTLAIYLDGSPISTPVVRDEIKEGRAQIT